MDDHLDDCGRQSPNLRNAGDKLAVQFGAKSLPCQVSLFLFVRIERSKVILKQRRHVWIPLASRSHRFNNVAGVKRMVVAVVADETSVFVLCCNKSASSVTYRL